MGSWRRSGGYRKGVVPIAVVEVPGVVEPVVDDPNVVHGYLECGWWACIMHGFKLEWYVAECRIRIDSEHCFEAGGSAGVSEIFQDGAGEWSAIFPGQRRIFRGGTGEWGIDNRSAMDPAAVGATN